MMRERFFYTIDRPYSWSAGPQICTYDPTTWADIPSLERAKELAEENRVDSLGEDCIRTTYGVMYE